MRLMRERTGRAAHDRVLRERDQLQREHEHLQRERKRLRREIERLKRQLDEARRAANRQAAPLAKETHAASPPAGATSLDHPP